MNNSPKMKQQPLVSVIINNYNYGKFLPRAIESSLKQTYPNIEIIVVDDGSSDNSKEIILDYQDKVIAIFKENEGQSSAINLGFALSRGEIICLLDSDDVFEADKVQKIVEIFNSYADIYWCFHAVEFVDTTTGMVCGRSQQHGTRLCNYVWQAHNIGKIPLYAPPTSGLSFKRSMLQEIWPINKSLKLGSDRYLTCVSVAKRKGYFLDKPLSKLGIHGANNNTLKQGKQIEFKRAYKRSLVAFMIQQKYPELNLLVDFLMSKSFVYYLKNTEIKEGDKIYVNQYISSLSFLNKLKFFAFSFFRIIGNLVLS